MAIKVLVVDDSSFFRRRVAEIINASPALEVIGSANNGQEAIEMVAKLRPDAVTMDVEMPVMDGITAVKKIMAATPVPILMFSSLTHQGASATLDALDAGACDFLPKKFEDIARDKKEAIAQLQQRIQAIALRRVRRIPETSRPAAASAAERLPTQATSRVSTTLNGKGTGRPVTQATASKRVRASGKPYDVLAIGTSTGGPVALQTVLSGLPRNFRHPIVLIQHMPGTFTKAFAERLNNHCHISVKEAENGDQLKPGWAYLAPGGKQMMVGMNGKIKIHDGSEALNYKPSVDITFASLSKSFANKVLAIVLTGMGADGRDGARMLKERGAEVWAQDEASCVVYGMPQAVAKAGLATQSIALDEIAKRILVELKYE